MTIRNCDGTIFSLSKPNPIMISQSLWSKDEIVILHNKFGKKILIGSEVTEPDIKKKETPAQIPQLVADEVDIWCLPAYYETKEDPLYGESHGILKYGSKFIFKGTIVESEDLYNTIACTDNITEGSVIFPKNKDKRWWRVNRKVRLPDGSYLINNLISDYQPSFG